LTLGAALGCGLVAGVCYAFSSFVMPALLRLPAAHGVAAMQAINQAALQRGLMAPFLGTALACLVLVVGSRGGTAAPGAALRLAACALYLLGTLGVTLAFNVPRNDALARLLPESAEAAVYWPLYVAEWGRWNELRAAAALAAAACFTLAY
jgi:uncharacterized membrane protein